MLNHLALSRSGDEDDRFLPARRGALTLFAMCPAAQRAVGAQFRARLEATATTRP